MTQGNASTNRRLANWLDSWLEYTTLFHSPEIFRKWAGISVLSSVMERKVWARTRGSNLYPNLYIILVGPPGIGKSAIVSQCERMLRAMEPDLHVAPSSVTTASVIDSLALATRTITRPSMSPAFMSFNSLQILASELGVFLPQYDAAFMNTMTKLYDGEVYEERRRSAKVLHVKLEHPLLSLLGGTTPSYLNSFLPEGAWDQGFTSRSILIYCGEQTKSDDNWFDEDKEKHDRLERLYIDLVHDLKLIHSQVGKVTWDEEVMQSIMAWDKAGGPPIPQHGKLIHYNTRRTAHLLKLCMTAMASRTQELRVTLTDYQLAMDWLLAAEHEMGDIFRSFGISGDARTMEDCYYYVFQAYKKDGKPISEHRIISFLASRTPSHQVQKIMEIMVRSNYLKQDLSAGYVGYTPLGKRPNE